MFPGVQQPSLCQGTGECGYLARVGMEAWVFDWVRRSHSPIGQESVGSGEALEHSKNYPRRHWNTSLTSASTAPTTFRFRYLANGGFENRLAPGNRDCLVVVR